MQKPRITVRSQQQATVTSRLAGRLGTMAGVAASSLDVRVPGQELAGAGRRCLELRVTRAVSAGVQQWPQRLQRPRAVEE